MNYVESLQKLYSIGMRGMKFGLENMLKLDSIIGNPSQQFQAIHVAGSNGKGSVCTKLAAALQASGKRVGLYTSPHISTFRERIRIDGVMIGEEESVSLLEEILAVSEIPATFFEVTTLLCFLYFARSKVDCAVLEVGLGGSLDATNIVTPSLSIITSISLEHCDLLGTTLEQIAGEKAGIIKPGIPILVGPRADQEIIRKTALAQNSPYIKVKGRFETFEKENQAVAKRAMELLELPIHLLAVRPPCRLEEVQEGVYLDVAHNPDGLEQLFRALHILHPGKPIQVVCALSKNKDIASCLRIIGQNAAHIIVTEANSERATPAADLYVQLIEQGYSRNCLKVERDAGQAVLGALAIRGDSLLLICGTFFIMSTVRQSLGIVEPTDSLPLIEKILAY